MDNPEQGLSAEFSADGMQVSAGEHSWSLAMEGYGYGESLLPLPEVTPTANNNRIEYSRGPLTEWYLNGPFGLDQGFTLARPPAVITGGPLTLALKQGGDLQASVGAVGRELFLSSASGEAVLRYTGLAAYDSDGRELHTWLESRPGVNGRPPLLLLRLDDHAAHYPLTVDPFLQKAKLTASDKAAWHLFGFSGAISGNVVVVGAPYADPGGVNDAGAAYVFVKPGGGWGNMTQTAKLTASDKATYDLFGISVSINGNVVVVGAYHADPGATTKAGAAYIFVKPGSGWVNMTQTAKLTASDKAAGDIFGSSVSINDNVVVVGAPQADPDSTTNAGAAYVFVKPGSVWGNMTQTAKLTVSDKAASDRFGFSVGISGDVVVVGAPQAAPGGTCSAGAAYVFVKPGSGWGNTTQTAKLTASDKAINDFFGHSVAIASGVVVVGAPKNSTGGTTDAGAAYVFVKPGSVWVDMTQTAKLTASDKAAGDLLGASVAISGGVVVAGAQGVDIGSLVDAGASYIFDKPAAGWSDITQTSKLTASDKAADDLFGNSVGVSGSTAVIAAYHADPGSILNAGTAYVFASDNVTVNKYSAGAYDGWVLESAESSGNGRITNATSSIFYLGDDQADKQYRAILSFNTASLPDTAVITSVKIKIKKQGLVGTNPFTTHQGLLVDIRKPYFGTELGLAAVDFQATASKSNVGTFGTTPSAGWYSVTLNSTARLYINKTGTTQFRLRFQKDDNDDLSADYLKFYSGNAATTSRPVLIIQYYVP
jgi:hypothetical protein